MFGLWMQTEELGQSPKARDVTYEVKSRIHCKLRHLYQKQYELPEGQEFTCLPYMSESSEGAKLLLFEATFCSKSFELELRNLCNNIYFM